jgi:hypothetical protein
VKWKIKSNNLQSVEISMYLVLMTWLVNEDFLRNNPGAVLPTDRNFGGKPPKSVPKILPEKCADETTFWPIYQKDQKGGGIFLWFNFSHVHP